MMLGAMGMLLFSSAGAGPVQLNKNDFHERYIENVNISGSIRAGVMFQSAASQVKPSELFVDIGTNPGATLCVRIISIDGHYEADFEYPIKKENQGLIQFALPTSKGDVVGSYAPDHLAVLAEVKKDCRQKKARFAPAAWGRPDNNTVKVFLNSGVEKTLLKIKNKEGKYKKLKCGKMKHEKLTAYDVQCVISNAAEYDLSTTRVLRKNFDNFIKPIKLNIQKMGH